MKRILTTLVALIVCSSAAFGQSAPVPECLPWEKFFNYDGGAGAPVPGSLTGSLTAANGVTLTINVVAPSRTRTDGTRPIWRNGGNTIYGGTSGSNVDYDFSAPVERLDLTISDINEREGATITGFLGAVPVYPEFISLDFGATITGPNQNIVIGSGVTGEQQARARYTFSSPVDRVELRPAPTQTGDFVIHGLGRCGVTSSIELIKSVSSVDDLNGNGIFGDAGDRINYDFFVVNTGNVPLADIDVSDDGFTLLQGQSNLVQPVSGFDRTLAVGEGTGTSGDPGPVLAATATYIIHPTDTDAGMVENTATVSGYAVAADDAGNPVPGLRFRGSSGVDSPPVEGASDAGSDPAVPPQDGGVGTSALVTQIDPSADGPNSPTLLNLPVLDPSLELIKTVSSVADTNGNGVFGDVGDTVNYSFTAENTGNTALGGIVVSDTDLAALDGVFVLTQPAAGFDGDLAIGEGPVEVATATYVLAASDIVAGAVTNTADVTSVAVATDAAGDPDPATPLIGVPAVVDDSDTGTDPTAVDPTDGTTVTIPDPAGTGGPDDPTVLTLNPPVPGIALVKAVSSVTDTNGSGVFGDAGDTVNFSFTVENTGNTSLAGIVVSDTDLAALDGVFVLTQPAGGFDGDLAIAEGPVEVATASYVLAASDIAAGGVTNTADVSAVAVVTGPGGDPDPATPLVGIPPAVDDSDAGSEPELDRATGAVPPVADPAGTGTGDDPTVLTLQPGGAFTLTKATTSERVLIGETVSYEIVATSLNAADFGPAQIVDTLPVGLAFVPGSATVDGVAVTPVVSGQTVTFSDLTLPANGAVTIVLQTRVLSSAPPGALTNVAGLVDQLTGEPLAEIASAAVLRTVESTFDCSPVIGKVFDDVNMDGYQDDVPTPDAMISNQDIFVDKMGGGKLSNAIVAQGEVGLAGVRLVTPSGTVITTDAHGRYAVPCAEIPSGIGSNFMLKLDTRTLPSGYRVTTENPRVMRLTSGLMTEMNFGAALGRVFDVDLSARAYGGDAVAPSQALADGLEGVLRQIADTPTVIRIAYYRDSEAPALARARLDAVEDLIQDQWADIGTYRLLIEQTVMQLQ